MFSQSTVQAPPDSAQGVNLAISEVSRPNPRTKRKTATKGVVALPIRNLNPPAEKADVAAIIARWRQTDSERAAIRAKWAALPTGSTLGWDAAGEKLVWHEPTYEPDSAVQTVAESAMVRKPRLLDLFSGAGGAAYGYMLAGFHVTGVDLKFQPRYKGDVFIQGDALEYLAAHGHEYDAIHASPPCQRYSTATAMEHRDKHPALIAPTRKLLISSGKPYVIENVPNARKHLIKPHMLCGSMFGLRVLRHRYFECGNGFDLPDFGKPPCRHDFKPVYMTGSTGSSRSEVREDFTVAEKREASRIDWMTGDELDEAIPPMFTKFIGDHLMRHIMRPADPVSAGERITQVVASGRVTKEGVIVERGGF